MPYYQLLRNIEAGGALSEFPLTEDFMFANVWQYYKECI